MLARVGLDCKALTQPSPDPIGQLQVHRRLVKALRRHAVLILPSDRHVHDAIRRIPDGNLRKLWGAALGELRTKEATPTPDTCICQMRDKIALRDSWRGQAEVALARRELATLLGVNPSQVASLDKSIGVEVAILEYFEESETFQNLLALNDCGLAKDEARDQIWLNRFLPLAKYSLHIAICDHYAGERLCRYYDGKLGKREAGLRWFLRELSTCPESYVHLIVALPKETYTANDMVDAVRCLSSDLKGKGISDLSLTIAHYKDFGRLAHDRHIRFDEFALRIGRGLEIFEREQQEQACECAYRNAQSMREVEDSLRYAAQRASLPKSMPITSASKSN